MKKSFVKAIKLLFCLCFICSGVILASDIDVNSLPDNFPRITTNIYDSNAIGEGYIYLTLNSDVNSIGNYLLILNNDGTPFSYKEIEDAYAYDFKVQPSGLFTYAQSPEPQSISVGVDALHQVMNTDLEVTDSFQMKTGSITDSHDFKMLPNGHTLLFGYYTQKIDLSNLVEGGDPNAMVASAVIQELNSAKNVIFQWRTWDYYNPEDFDWSNCSGMPVVSKLLPNAISLDKDSQILIGTDEGVKKISRQNGDVIWNLGGVENEFSFVGVDANEAVNHFIGNDFHRLTNGNYLIYCNGNASEEKLSQVLEYKLDDVNNVAELVWQYVPDVNIYGCYGGNAQRLPNGNTFICWAQNDSNSYPVCSEVTPDGNTVFEVYFDSPDVKGYRAYRMPFPTEVPVREVAQYELMTGNTYDFTNSTTDTGVSIKVLDSTVEGYNEASVRRESFAPLYPEFGGTAPCVVPTKIIISQYGIYYFNAQLMFDNSSFNFDDPNSLTVYYRQYKDRGFLMPLYTYNNYVIGKLKATLDANIGYGDDIGEFVFCYPDLEHIIYSPVLIEPEDMEQVNQELPVELFWAPKGFVNRYHLQISLYPDFTDLLVDSKYLKESQYTLEDTEPDTVYYWRVSTVNDAGQSEWSQSSFSTVSP
ncbi:MAG: hypothetical protein JXA96_12695 [Sedimentisphaerales bacterium]|nr:hypothetical protein [Sedimentisphaerales bacterium]